MGPFKSPDVLCSFAPLAEKVAPRYPIVLRIIGRVLVQTGRRLPPRLGDLGRAQEQAARCADTLGPREASDPGPGTQSVLTRLATGWTRCRGRPPPWLIGTDVPTRSNAIV
jgi:hypothetical protein